MIGVSLKLSGKRAESSLHHSTSATIRGELTESLT
jgi:hypothetical protein